MNKTQNKYPEQYIRLQKVLKKRDLDAVLAISFENVYWLSQSLIHTQKSIPDRLAIVLSIRGEDPVFLVCSIEESLVRSDSWIKDIRCYEEFEQSPIQALAEIMHKKGLSKGKIGLEKHYLCASYYEELKSILPKAEWINISKDFEKLRMIKTEREIEILQKAALNTEKAMIDTFLESKPGDAEKDVLNRIILKTLNAGGMEANGSFGSGPKSAVAHPIADNTPLEKGGIVSVDFGASFQGYYSDLGRTAVVEKSSDRQNKIYHDLYDVQRRCIDMIRPGVKVSDIFKAAYNGLNEAGLELSLSHVGHGIGLIMHEEPMLSPFNDLTLQENMVINIEPFYVTDEGYHSEDTMLVTTEGAKIFSNYYDHSSIIPITAKGK